MILFKSCPYCGGDGEIVEEDEDSKRNVIKCMQCSRIFPISEKLKKVVNA